MLPFIRPAADKHVIDEGQVHCPLRRRDVEFDVCVGCAFRSEIDLDAQPPYVRCRPDVPLWAPVEF